MLRIGYIGVPSSGKTQVARALSSLAIVSEKFKTVDLVGEYARDYISKFGSIDSIHEQYRILEKQLEWEETKEKNPPELLITDSPIFLAFVYSMHYKEDTIKDAAVLSNIFKKLSNWSNFPWQYFYLSNIF